MLVIENLGHDHSHKIRLDSFLLIDFLQKFLASYRKSNKILLLSAFILLIRVEA